MNAHPAVIVVAASVLLASAGPGQHPPAPAPLVARPPASAAVLDAHNARVDLHLAAVLPGAERRGRPAIPVPVHIVLVRYDGRWQSAEATAAGFLTGPEAVDASDLTLTGQRLSGTLRLAVRPVPPRGEAPATQPTELVVTVDAEVQPVRGPASAPAEVDLLSERFWTIFPESQGACWELHGTWATAGAAIRTGPLTGRAVPPNRPGHWNMGRWAGDGMAFDFDLGTRRQNWNFARIAVLELPGPTDLRGVEGLRVTLRTDRPRPDVSASVWLREADGSWYYYKSAVPLADPVNSADLLFADFAEAEWVAPGNHMDEDYVLDLSAVTAVGLGVVNPLGVGPVSFTLSGLDLLPRPAPASQPAPARLTVSGRTLGVNGHNVVPAGLFGGYAPDLGQEYRPGCQRTLTGPGGPNVPRQLYVRYHARHVPDWPALVAALHPPATASGPATRLVDHLRELLPPDQRQGLARVSAGRVDRPDRVPDILLWALNHWLSRRELYTAEAWADVPLPDGLRNRAAAGSAELNTTEVMELNRRLLDAAFPGLLVPPPAEGPTEQFILDCWFDRYSTAVLLNNPNWREDFARWGRDYALKARQAGYRAYLEFWNEPYLNWATRPGKNYGVNMFNVAEAREGGPVQVLYRTAARDAQGQVLRDAPPIETDGPVIPYFTWQRVEPSEQHPHGWRVVDSTQFTYWSGRGNGWIYDQMLRVLGPAVKAANPDVQVIAGWGFRWNEDHWAAWDMLYKPTIDRNIRWIDGIHEHHYQGDTTAMAGAYETLVAYGQTRHNKWLYCYNTETNDLLDAPARGAVDTPEKARAATQYRRMVYNLRDCLYLVRQCPDKAMGRTVIHCTSTPAATAAAFGLMANLRGRLIETASDDPALWCVANVDGTDPAALPPVPRSADPPASAPADTQPESRPAASQPASAAVASQPAGPPQTLVVIVFNDQRTPRSFTLDLVPPAGTRFVSGAARETRTVADLTTYAIGLEHGTPAVEPTGGRLTRDLPARGAWKIELPLEGRIVAEDEVQRRQFFAPDILQRVGRGQPAETRVALDPALLGQARRGWLRIVLEDVTAGEGTVTVNGRPQPLPKAVTADNVNQIAELPLDLATLTPETTVRYELNAGNHAGFQVDMTSIVLETGPATP